MTKKQFSKIVAGLCGYELLAISSGGKLPTLTVLDKRARHAISPVLLLGLAVHFYAGWPTEKELSDGRNTIDWKLRLRGYPERFRYRDTTPYKVEV